MRLQSGIICDAFEVVPGYGYTVSGVSPVITVEGVWRGPPGSSPPPIPITKKLLLILLDGLDGPHNLLLTVLYSGREDPIVTRPISFDWPAEAPSHLMDIELNMSLPGGGLYDFHILVDGEPIATIPLRIVVNVTHGN